jgi:branched-subunit amino acid transport protein
MVIWFKGFYPWRRVFELRVFNNYLYGLYAVILAVVSIFTREIVAFIMLGFVFMALLNINSTLQKILEKIDKD